MSIIFDLFEPSRRHREEERNRLEWTRDEEGLGDPHRGPIDLDSGVVKVKVSDEDQDDAGPALTPSGPNTEPSTELSTESSTELSAEPSTEPNSAAEADRPAQNPAVTKPAAS